MSVATQTSPISAGERLSEARAGTLADARAASVRRQGMIDYDEATVGARDLQAASLGSSPQQGDHALRTRVSDALHQNANPGNGNAIGKALGRK